MFQRSVTSVCRCRVTPRATSAVWTVRGRTPACVNRAGGVSAVTRVRERESYLTVISSLFSRIYRLVFSQILMSVKTQNSLRAATKCVTTSPGASCAAARRASTHTTTSTASVSVTGQRSQVRGQPCFEFWRSEVCWTVCFTSAR